MTLAQLAEVASMAPGGRRPDWALVVEALGTPLPSDYVEMIDGYGGGVFVEYIRVFEPQAANNLHDVVRQTELRRGDLAMFWARGVRKPAELEAPGLTLVNWADTISGEYLYWLATPGTPPDRWPVALESGNDDEWEFFAPGCVAFLTDVLSAKTSSFYLDDLTEEAPPSFKRY